MSEKLPWGVALNRPQTTVVLAWREVVLRTPKDIQTAVERANKPDASGHKAGLYVFEGVRNGLSERHVLYLGQGGIGEKLLGQRISESARTFIEQRTSPYYFYDSRDLVVRFAHMDPALVKDVEALQILAHAPPFNAQGVRAWARGETDYVVLNAGLKGSLLPAVSSIYFRDGIWLPPPLDYEEPAASPSP